MSQKRYAYLIGANGPEYQNITPLQYAEKDVEHLQRALSEHPCEFDDVKSTIATNPSDVLTDLELLATSCERPDLLMVHFSGHGKVWGGQLYLICNNSQINAKLFESTAINISRLKNILDLCSAKHKLLILDCCHASTAHAGGTWRGEQELEAALQDIKGSVSAILSACAAHKPTRELDALEIYSDKGAGFLSWALATACSEHFTVVSRDRALSLSDILSWLPEVRNRINQDLKPNEQIPLPRLLSERDIAGDDEIWFTKRRREHVYTSSLEERQQREEHVIHNQEPFLRQYCFGAEIEDFEEGEIRAFAQKQRSFSRHTSRSTVELCKRLGLASSVGTPRRLAVLAFHKFPNHYISPAVIRVTLRTLDNDIYSIGTIEGPLGEQVKKAVQWLIGNLRTIREDAEVGQRTDRCEIPQKALQELVVNAVLHRDYEANESVQIKITPKQIIITNPGRLNPAIVGSNSPFSYRESHPRNPELLDVLIAQRWAEGIAHGFEIITEEFQKYNLPLPDIKNLPGSLVQVIIQRPDISIIASSGGVAASVITGSISASEQGIPTRQWLQPRHPSLPKSFVGRREELQELIGVLIGDKSTITTGQRTLVVIQGMGGIGKTYLARKLAMDLYNSFPGGVIWIDFGPQARDEQGAQVLLRHLTSYAFGGNPPAGRLHPDLVAAWLEEMAPGRLLVIFDDVWDRAILRILEQAVPENSARIITTRNTDIAVALSGKVITLDRLSLEDGLTMLEDRLGTESNNVEYRADLEKLVGMLGGHPLALEIAIAGLTRKKIYQQPLKQLLENLEEHVNHNYLASLRLPTSEERDNSLEKSLALSYQPLSAERRGLFRILGAFSAGEPISVQAAATIWGVENQDTAQAALYDLVDFGLLEELENLHYQLHPILHSYARALLEREGELERACWAQAQYYTDMSRHAVGATPRDYSLLDQHLQNILLALQWTSEKEPALFIQLLDTVSQFLLLRGQITLLETYLPNAIVKSQTVANSKLSGSLLKSLGDLENRLGNIDQARAHYDAALPLYRTERDRLGEAHLLQSLGDLESRLGNIDQARAHYDAALPLYHTERDRLGEANLLQSLGDLESRLGNIDQARAHYDAVLPLYRTERDRMGEANLLRSLGDLERRLGNIDQARAHYDAALPLYRTERAHLGEANLLKSLGDLESRLGNIDQARAHYDAALPLYRIERDRLGEANLLRSLGDLERRLGNIDQARAHYDAALPLYRIERDRLGEANLLQSLGDLESRLGNIDQARAHYDAALPLYRTERDRMGEANLLRSLGDLERRLGNIDQARAHYDAALPLYRIERDRLGEANLLRSLGDLESRLSKFDEARNFYNAALPLYRIERARLGEANVYLSLGDMAMSLKQWKQARTYYEQALPLYIAERDLYGQANTLIDLGSVQFDLGEHEQGLKDVQQAARLFHTVQDEEWARRAELRLLKMRTKLGQAEPSGELIDSFISVQSPQQMFELAQQHPQLLTDSSLALIEELIATQTDNQARQHLSEGLSTLEQIRQGVEEKATVLSALDEVQKTKEKRKI